MTPRARERTSSALTSPVTGPARVDARTRALAHRLRPGDVAVIDHVDLDRGSAEALVAARPVAVLNAARSTSGRYPNLGPEVLLDAGIPLVDDLGPDVMSLTEGRDVRIDGDAVLVGEDVVAEGVRQTDATVAAAVADARSGLAVQLESFAATAMDVLLADADLLLDGAGVPVLRTPLDQRVAVVVAAGSRTAAELRAMRSWVHDVRPVLIGVDGGADAILAAGWRPQVVAGGLEQVSDAALAGAELVLVGQDADAPGGQRADRLGLPLQRFETTVDAEEAALLLADRAGAAMIVTVGGRDDLRGLLDRGRTGMASAVLTRVCLRAPLVDARAVARLHGRRISGLLLGAMVLAGLLALGVALATTPSGQSLLALAAEGWQHLTGWLGRLLGSGT